MLVAQDFLHGLCFVLACLTPVFSSFCIHKPSSATTKLAKKRNTWFCLRCAGLFCLSNDDDDDYYYYLGCCCLVLVAQDVLHSLCFLLVSLLQFFLAFGSGSLHRLQGLQKNKKHPGRTHKTTKGTQQCLGAGLSSEDCFWGGLCFWIRKPSSATRTAKNKQTPEESTKNKPNDSQNVWAQDFLQRLRFLCLLYVFVIFGSGSFHQLLGLQKKQKHLRKQQKLQENKNAKGFSGMSGPRIFFLQSV